ncbi:TlpA disulfide reductase family protein [Flavitalea sp. BT771]|uniref:TlpA disulfide reductase family protein n=1 Tax=Flavitalea sp. BT771 TaxID=3063329 RepID=UPI0026E1192B|nr:TlpA disulfide reductase family protein [Flavitalea sp. BT771]MDO6431077.1 TlpA disulfide reductase family protein [Flavitalea sp. BT771]MDV6219984.1 TlpA disulfide reductase family protein [Flavitalea sp. BT771]
MKKSLFILFVLLSAASFARADRGFIVTGQLTNFKDSILYMNYGSFAGSRTDTVKVINGQFVFKGSVSEPVPAMIFTPTFRVKIDLYVDNTTINITGNADSMSSVKVMGNAAVDEFEAFNQAVQANRQATIALFNEAYNKKIAGDTAAAAKIQAQADKQYAYEHEIRLNFIKTHPASYISARELLQMTNNESLAESRKLYAALDSKVQQSAQGREVADRIALLSKIETGRQALPFTQSSVDGKTVTLADFRGKYVLLEFWASWCGPCRAENPNLRKQYQLYKDKGLEIVGVSLDHDKGAWVKAIEKDQLPWVHVSDLQGWKNAVSTSYGIMGVPANFLIDPQGKIVAQNLRGEALNKKLEEILH